VVRALAHRVVVLRQGRMVEQGDADEMFANPREDYTRALMAAAFTLEDSPALGNAVQSGL
jgi:microcin C transport system ATP-binding protein